MVRSRLAHFASDLQGFQIYLFGSRATGHAKLRSDFDLGVHGSSPLPLKVFFAIEDALENIPTLYSFDWVDLNRVDDKFFQEAMKGAQIIYGQTPIVDQ